MSKKNQGRDYYDDDYISDEEYEYVPSPVRKPVKKKKRRIGSHFLWLLLFIVSILFFITFLKQPMFPKKWSLVLLLILAVILFITGFFTKHLSNRNRFQKTVNCILVIALLIGTIALPYYVDKVSNLINSATNDVVYIDLYAMSDSYKEAHADIFQNTIELPDKKTDMKEYADAVYGTAVSSDETKQKYALEQLNKLCGKSVQTIDSDTLADEVSNLYNNHTDIMITSHGNDAIIEEMSGYENFSTDTVLLYQIPMEIQTNGTVRTDMTDKPFTIFFGGNDEEGSLTLEGRTDVDMMVTVNPNTHQIAIINMPRDSYLPNPAYNGARDKLTHFGLKGIDNTLTGLSDVMDQKIQNYVIINFTTFKEIINAMGGTLTIDNPYAFTAVDGTTYDEGKIELNADTALMYCRERYNLPNGDFDRAAHQQIVMQAIINKLTSKSVITHFNDLLNRIQGKFLTNISSDSIYALCQKQLDENIKWNIVKYHIQGTAGSEICASAPGQALSVVYPYTNQIAFCQDVMNQVENGETITQEELPEGSFEDDDSE